MNISPKAAGTYLDCPKHYRFEYVDRPRMPRRGGPWAHQSLGNSVHQALSLLMDEPPERRTPDRAVQLLAQVWQVGGYRDDAQKGLWFTIAADWVVEYVARPEVADTVTRANERNVQAPYGDGPRPLILAGKVDRIDERDGSLVVVDYKTGRRAPDVAEAAGSYALAVYVWAARRTWGGSGLWCTRAELHHLPTGTVVSVDYDRERITRILDRLADVAREIEGATTYPARPGPLCASCPFLDYCDEGKTDGRTRAPGWSYLPAPDAAGPPSPPEG